MTIHKSTEETLIRVRLSDIAHQPVWSILPAHYFENISSKIERMVGESNLGRSSIISENRIM